MMFIYQCVNKNKKINLLIENYESTLEKLKNKKININIFDELLDENKMIKKINKNSIFISNNNKLKNVLRNKKEINCFSSNNVEALLDWKA